MPGKKPALNQKIERVPVIPAFGFCAAIAITDIIFLPWRVEEQDFSLFCVMVQKLFSSIR